MSNPARIDNKLHNNTSTAQESARDKLRRLFKDRPFSDEMLLTNFGLFFRSSALAKMFFLKEVYEKIMHLPGDLYVFGVWLGQDIVGLESMRAMMEPYNASRKIIGFDTFDGYDGMGDKDTIEKSLLDGYNLKEGYQSYLEELLAYHRSENCMGHAVTHTLVKGDVQKTAPDYFKEHPESMVAMAYFDLAIYKPTMAALDATKDRLFPGSVIVFDELNDPRYPGETIAFREWVKGMSYEITRSAILPDRTFVTIK